MIFKDYYKILGLDNSKVSASEIKAAYREQAKLYHPDVNAKSSFSEERFKDINEAYRVLSNSSSKRKYARMWNNHAASSISSEIPLTNPVNIKTARPAPNPRYTIIIPSGLLKCNMLANLDKVNITIWNGTIMENRQSIYIALVTFVCTRTIYHAHIEQHKIITSTEPTVINREVPNADQKSVLTSALL